MRLELLQAVPTGRSHQLHERVPISKSHLDRGLGPTRRPPAARLRRPARTPAARNSDGVAIGTVAKCRGLAGDYASWCSSSRGETLKGVWDCIIAASWTQGTVARDCRRAARQTDRPGDSRKVRQVRFGLLENQPIAIFAMKLVKIGSVPILHRTGRCCPVCLSIVKALETWT